MLEVISEAGGTLELQLLSAHGLMNTDFFSKSDPYAIIKYGSQVRKSNVAKNQGSDPIWNQRFRFLVEDGATEVVLSLYDEDFIKTDDFLGKAIIPVPKLPSKDASVSHSSPVVLPSGRCHGEVKVKIMLIPKVKSSTALLRRSKT